MRAMMNNLRSQVYHGFNLTWIGVFGNSYVSFCSK